MYLLAFSGYDNDPLSRGEEIFDQASATERSGPDGDGGDGELDGWTGVGEYGKYVIALTGAALLDDDCSDVRLNGTNLIPTVSDWGLVILALAILTGGTVVFGRR